MGSKTSRNLTGRLGDDTMVEQNGRYASSSFGKENEDVGRDVYRQRRTPPVQRRRKGHGNSSVNYKEQQKYRREVNNEKRRTPQKSAKQHSVDHLLLLSTQHPTIYKIITYKTQTQTY